MELNKKGQQLLSEIIDSGVGKSAEKLAAMSNAKWEMQSISVKAGPVDQLSALFKDDGKEYYAAVFSMPGGAAILLASLASTRGMAKAYMGGRSLPGGVAVEQLDASAIGEIANVLVNTMAAGLADACGISFLITGPKILKDKKPRLSGEINKLFPWTTKDLAMSSYVSVTSTALSVDCSMIMLLNEALAGRVIRTLNAAE